MGEPTNANAHPRFDQSRDLALVHNGVIENYRELKQGLVELGHEFCLRTDTEVLAHLVGYAYASLEEEPSREKLTEALRLALQRVTGTYGIILLHRELPAVFIASDDGVFGKNVSNIEEVKARKVRSLPSPLTVITRWRKSRTM